MELFRSNLSTGVEEVSAQVWTVKYKCGEEITRFCKQKADPVYVHDFS